LEWNLFLEEGIYFTPIGVEFVFRRGNIFYSNWRGVCKKKRECYIFDFGNLSGICKKKKKYILLQLEWN
jgi:hypothetical protein